ncbi:FAD binding domain-containing protein [Vallitalea okinawensis]|uniref:FAD binding domain-containing protein n=1 Tax=Vallitalea okinawensis TaxID=2078660 RepID=UPI000CFB75F7|nr:FAD binding domain-containing protein [Vallitalea okinawensis]
MVAGTIPRTYKEALDLLNNGDLTIMAGGTDLMVKRRNWSGCLPYFSKDVLIISGLDELNFIRREKGYTHIGANVTLENLKTSQYVPKLVKEAAALMASPAIRHIGTIGGNLGNASPAGDSLPPLYLLDAEVVLESSRNERCIAIEELITAPGRTSLKNNEIIREIIIKEPDFSFSFYKKVGGRKADAISKVSFSGVATVRNYVIEDFRVAFGAVGPKVVRERSIENQLIGCSLQELKEKKEWIKKQYESSITPIDDQRSTAEYRKTCSMNLLDYFIQEIR